MTTINLYGQFTYHDDAEIIGDRKGLTALCSAINAALDDSRMSDDNAHRIDVFASDGEGYMLSVILIEEPESRFPDPAYIGNEIDKAFGRIKVAPE
jgi:hypothetical protein